jgi:hypothetical protein
MESETESSLGVTDEVVDRSKTVKGTAVLAAKHGMNPLAIDRHGRHFKDVTSAHRRDQLSVGRVRLATSREHEADSPRLLAAKERAEQSIRLGRQLPVGGNHPGVARCARRAQVQLADLGDNIARVRHLECRAQWPRLASARH